jgi:hypothetical protein
MEGIAKLAGAPSLTIVAYECFGFSRVRFAGSAVSGMLRLRKE